MEVDRWIQLIFYDVVARRETLLGGKRKAPSAPRPKRRRKTKAAPDEPVLSEYELGRRAKIKRNNKFLVSIGLLFPSSPSVYFRGGA